MNSPEKEKPPLPEDSEESANWSHDIENREYYYDDATGYETYDPEKDDDDEEKRSGDANCRG